MARRKAAELAVAYTEALALGPDPDLGKRAEAWADTERRIVKAILSGGARRLGDVGLRPEELRDARCRAVLAAACRRIEGGARTLWLDGGIEAEVARELPIERAHEAVAWVKGAADEADDEAVDALVVRLRDRAFLARAWGLAGKLRQTMEPGTSDAAEGAVRMIAELRDLTEERYQGASSVQLQTAVEGWDDWVKSVREEVTTKRRAYTGITAVDRLIRMPPGEMTAIGAESHVGKTGLCAAACLASARAGVGAAFVSLEDPWGEIVSRAAAEIGRFNPNEVRENQLGLGLQEKLDRARMGLVGLPLWGIKIRDRSYESVLVALRQAARRGALLVCLDYVQAIRRPRWAGSGYSSRRDWIDEVLAEILAASADRNLHLVLASQLNRDKARKEVTKNDIRETQAIGDAAKNILMFRALPRVPGKPRGVEALIEKAKGTGSAGTKVMLTRDDYGVLIEATDDPAAPENDWGAS